MSAPAPAMTIGVTDFVDGEYFAHVRASLSPSTTDGYEKMWGAYRQYFAGVGLDIRTCEAQGILRAICAANPHLTKTTLRHVKNFFSGVWSHALRMGAVDRENPWRHTALPAAPEGNETYAYSPQDIETILSVAPKPYDLVILLAACTGLRKSEIRGLRWSDWDAASSTLSVNRACWRGHVKETKSRASKAPVPVVPILAAKLTEYRGNSAGARSIFQNTKGAPLDLDNAARRFIAPALEKTAVKWVGWHAFRRGLATFLHSRGVDDKTIQAILRHDDVSITQRCYVKTVPESVRKAMETVNFGGSSR